MQENYLLGSLKKSYLIMNVFKLEGADDTPSVTLDKENNIFEISGRSIPENVMDFYNPILDWLTSYAEAPLEETVFVFKMLYYNTASSKYLMEVLLKLEDIYRNGHKVFVKWYYPHNDGDIEDGGKDYFDIVKIPHEMLQYKISVDDEQVKLLLSAKKLQNQDSKVEIKEENLEQENPDDLSIKCPYCGSENFDTTFGTKLAEFFGFKNHTKTYKCDICGNKWNF